MVISLCKLCQYGINQKLCTQMDSVIFEWEKVSHCGIFKSKTQFNILWS